jgi:hypothetical protein
VVKMRARVPLVRFPQATRTLDVRTEHPERRLAVTVVTSSFVPRRVAWLALE